MVWSQFGFLKVFWKRFCSYLFLVFSLPCFPKLTYPTFAKGSSSSIVFSSGVCSQEGRCFVDILFTILISIGACGMTTWTHSHSVQSFSDFGKFYGGSFVIFWHPLWTSLCDQKQVINHEVSGVTNLWAPSAHQTTSLRARFFGTKENSPFFFSDPGCATSERLRNLGDEFFVGKKGSFGDFGGVVKCLVFQCFFCWDGMLFSLQSQIL